VAEQGGKVRIVEGGGTLATFLDISARVDSSDERGLLGLALVDLEVSRSGALYLLSRGSEGSVKKIR